MTDLDDAAAIEPYATALADALVAAVPNWMTSAITDRLPAAVEADVSAATSAAIADIESDLRVLLATDIDEQTTTPLAIARRVVGHAASVLEANDVAPAQRDDHARSLHPDDSYDLTPGGFIDFGDDAQAAGIAWGAAKAHIHMRRHAPAAANDDEVETTDQPSETDDEGQPPIGAVVPNIMDRSRFGGDVTFLSEAEAATQTDLALLIVDLDRVGELAPLVSERFPTIGFGSHVDEARLAEAEHAGMAAAMARSIFFKRLPDIVRPTGADPAS